LRLRDEEKEKAFTRGFPKDTGYTHAMRAKDRIQKPRQMEKPLTFGKVCTRDRMAKTFNLKETFLFVLNFGKLSQIRSQS